MKINAAFAVAAVLMAVATPTATAAPSIDGEFSVPDQPRQLTLGPDGNIWVTLAGVTQDIAKITPSGTVTSYNPANISSPVGVVAGPDGNMWVTQSGAVAKFSPANPNGAVNYANGDIVDPRGLTVGADGNLWTASLSKVIKIPPATPLLYAFYPGLTGARGITAGNDGRLWVADFGGQSIVSVTTGGVATPHPVGGGPQEVAAGLGGQVAYTNPGAVPQSIGRLEQGGTAQPTQTPLSDPFGITFGSDQAYWTAQFAANNLGRLTPDGQYTTLGGFSANSGPRYIAKGTNNTLWVTLETINKVARVSGLEPPAPTPTADTTPPIITALSMSSSAFRVGAKSTPTIARRVPVGTKIRLMLSEASSVRLVIERALPGRRSGETCVRPRKALRRKRKCTRYKRIGALQRQGAVGKNSVSFSGRIGRKALKPGRYRLIVTATDAAGNAGTANPKRFRVLATRKW